MSSKKILFVFTSADKTLTGKQTGWYLPEAAHPYYVLSTKFEIDFAAPAGPNPPADENSVKNFKSDEQCAKFLVDPVAQDKLKNAKKLTEVKASDYVAIFYPGGHGPVLDLAVDEENIKLANEFYRSGKIVSAVCHGPAAIVGVTDASGKSIFSGKEATAFSNAEEEIVKMVQDIPFLVEDRIVAACGA
ncbi:ThiJ/PfpI [Schizopora paradoxa]|uniref:D-lactate dehydratase n=1 Tax=Schizopora paradoxa TaxID=27342 RepID=A0A0H2SDC1_9AGAM|nr:ThiJ/PfpI [Schizopora paradoxa]